jgi:hypothetical protein
MNKKIVLHGMEIGIARPGQSRRYRAPLTSRDTIEEIIEHNLWQANWDRRNGIKRPIVERNHPHHEAK